MLGVSSLENADTARRRMNFVSIMPPADMRGGSTATRKWQITFAD